MFEDDVTSLATQAGMQMNPDGTWNANLAQMQIYTSLIDQARELQNDVFRSMFDERTN